MMRWMRRVGQACLVLSLGLVLGVGCSHGGGPIACGDETCDGSSEYCKSFTVEALGNDGSTCAPLPDDYDTKTCQGLCEGGDSIANCMCDDNGCSVLCISP